MLSYGDLHHTPWILIMARITAVLTAINDVCGPILIPDEETHYVSVYTDGAADGSVVLESSGQDDGASPVAADQWVAEDTITSLSATPATPISPAGAAKHAFALLPGARKVRIRKSVAGTGPMRVTLNVTCI